MPPAFSLQDAQATISDGGLCSTADTDLFLTTCKGGVNLRVISYLI